MYIDTHCHLSSDYYDDIDTVINDNIKANVSKIIISGCDKNSIQESILLAEKYENIYLTIGYHPEEVDNVLDSDLDNLRLLLNENKKIVGVGEIGLDYLYKRDNRVEQISLFEKQLKIAEDLNLPVIIHSRDAVSDTIECLKKYNVRGVIHCFSGSLEVANIYIDMGFKLGIGGVVTFKNSKLGEVVKNVKLDNIVLETDSPYLAPDPYRGTVNSSKNLSIIAHKLSELYKLDMSLLEEKIMKNTLEIFKIDK